MSSNTTKQVTCITCPPAFDNSGPYHQVPEVFTADHHTRYIQCGRCVMAEKPLPHAQQQARQLELAETAS